MEAAPTVTSRILNRALRLSIAATVSLLFLAAAPVWSQNTNGMISGTITDASDAVVPDAEISLVQAAHGVTIKTVSGAYGTYSFPNLEPGSYDLRVSAARFRPVFRRAIPVDVGRQVRVDVRLEIGSDVQTLEITAVAPQLNFDNATRADGFQADVLNELPLEVANGNRFVQSYAVLLPGVTTGGGNNAYDARINGGMVTGDEAILDGASMQEGYLSQSGMVAAFDFRLTPDMVSEFEAKTSTYEPEYGATTGGNSLRSPSRERPSFTARYTSICGTRR